MAGSKDGLAFPKDIPKGLRGVLVVVSVVIDPSHAILCGGRIGMVGPKGGESNVGLGRRQTTPSLGQLRGLVETYRRRGVVGLSKLRVSQIHPGLHRGIGMRPVSCRTFGNAVLPKGQSGIAVQGRRGVGGCG
eukprot:scaffold4226_cov180-Amphora_coffeaeformis.AAC.10